MQSDDQSGGAKRPRATIEGSAREISKNGGESPGKEQDGDAVSENGATAAASTRPGLRAVIAISVMSGLCAVLAVFAILALMRFSSQPTAEALRQLVGAEAPARDVAALGQQTEAMRARLVTLERLEEQLADLSRRSDAIEQASATAGKSAADANAANADHVTRIDQLETRFGTLDSAALSASSAVEEMRREISAAAQTGASAAAVASRLALARERIDALESTLRGMEQNLSLISGEATNLAGDIERATSAQSELARRIDALEGGAGADGNSISARVARFESDMASVSNRFNTLALPALITAHDALLAKASRGAAFERELAALAAQIGDEPALLSLHPFGARAVPTLAMLAERLEFLSNADASEQATEPAPSPEPSLVGRIIERANRAVQIRRIETGANQDEISRARNALDKGDITAAAAIIAALAQNPARDAWLDDARARVELEAALSALDAVVQSHLAAASSNENG